MTIARSSIVQVSMNKITLTIRVGVDDLTAERAIIASNEEAAPGKLYWLI